MMKLGDLLLANCEYWPTTTLQIKIHGSCRIAERISLAHALIKYGDFDVQSFEGTYIILAGEEAHEKEKNNFASR